MSPKGLPVKEISSLQVLKLVTFNRLDSTKLVTSSNFFFGEESVRRKEIGKNCWLKTYRMGCSFKVLYFGSRKIENIQKISGQN